MLFSISDNILKVCEGDFSIREVQKGWKHLKQKDVTEKILESYNDVFADIINGLLFEGAQRVSPDSLSEASVHSQYKAGDGRVHEEERDVLKEWDNCGIEFALLGVENQSKAEKYMPMRVIGYDGATYRNQLLGITSKTRFIPRPVITVVLYFGTEHRWKQPRNLLSLVNVPEGLQGFVNDYVITVFEVAWLSDEQVKRFHSDFKVVANFFTRKRQNKDYIPDDPTEIKHVDEVLKLLSAMTGDRRYEGLLSAGEEIGNMCDVAERLERKGIEIGANNTIFKLVSKGRLTPEEGAEELNMEMTEFMNALEEWKLTAKAH